jgi:hypothetical protein
MQRPATMNDLPAGATPDASNLHFRDQNEADERARDDATTVAFEGRMKVSGDDDAGGAPYNWTGRFKRTVR